MAKIDCEVTNCSHNKSGECYANCVDIVGSSATKDYDTACGSYLNRLHYSELTNNTLSEGSNDCLKCTVVTCTYNDNKLCSLGHILVSADNGNPELYTQTKCASYKYEE